MLDLDEDGDLDIYCTYDNHFPNKFYQNDGFGQFKEIGESLNLNYRGDGMGVDFADFDHNGYYDFYITNFYPNALMMQQPDGTFIDQAEAKGVGDEGMGWGTVCLDYNNDSYADIFMVNSAHPAGIQGFTNKLYRNNGDGSFSSVDQGSPLGNFNDSWSCASADFNDDGLTDLVIVNTNGHGVQVMKNSEENTGNWIRMNLVGTTLNKFAVGARVEVWQDGFALKDEVTVGSGYSGQNSYTLHFGLGSINTIDSLLVHWPTGTVDKYYNPEVNERLLIVENESLDVFDINAYTRALGVSVVTDVSEDNDVPLSIYPIPAQKFIYIEGLESSPNIKLQLTDMSGRRKYLQQLSGKDRIELDIRSMSPGIYLLQSQTDRKEFVKRIVIE